MRRMTTLPGAVKERDDAARIRCAGGGHRGVNYRGTEARA